MLNDEGTKVVKVFLHISKYFGISGVNNVVFPLMLQRFCVALVLLVLCYDRSAVHVSVLAMPCVC